MEKKPLVKNFETPDQRPDLPKGHAKLVNMGEMVLLRGTLDPGWRWSNDWQKIMGTPSCQMPHFGVTLSGQWHFEMDDGTSVDLGPGDCYSIPPGHDAWVVGDEPVVTLDILPANADAETARIMQKATQ